MQPLLTSIVVSAGLGALIGLIRQWSELRDHANLSDFGGVRTYTLWAVLGCLGAYLSDHNAPGTLPVLVILIALQFVVVHLPSAMKGTIGSTTFGTALITCLLGALVQWQQTQAAVLVGALTMVILGSKQPLHRWTHAFTSADIRAILQFAAITGVVLPLVPNRALGPYAAFNPYSTWLMVVLISGVGFVGYALMRLLGAQAGINLTGLVGGLASSTATTLALSRQSRETPALDRSFALAVNLACAVMPVRVLVMIWLLDEPLAWRLAPALFAMAAPGFLYALGRRLRPGSSNRSVDTPAMRNPLSLGTALKFALLYALFAFFIKAVTALHWSNGVLPLSFLSGLTDMDAITLLMANGTHDGSVALPLAAQAVIIGAVANSLMKGALALFSGSSGFRWRVVVALAASVVAGGAAAWVSL